MSSVARYRYNLGTLLLFVSDLFAVYASAQIGVFLRRIAPRLIPELPPLQMDFQKILWFFPVWIAVMAYEGAYSKKLTFWDEIKLLWKSTAISLLVIFTFLFVGRQTPEYPRTIVMIVGIMALIVLPPWRTYTKQILHRLGLRRKKILIIGSGRTARLALHAIQNEPNLGYDVVGILDDRENFRSVPDTIDGIKVHHGISRIDRYLRRSDIQDILIAKPRLEKERLIPLINTIQHKVDNTLFIPDLEGIAVLGTRLRHFFNEQAIVLEVRNNLADPVNYFAKRIFDYLISLVVIGIFLVPFLIIYLAIVLTSRGPGIFRHRRIGKGGRPFSCFKFRTMYADAEERLEEILARSPEARDEWDTFQKLVNDPRITPVGRLLRQTSLDELPQLLNVVLGQMSLVGPRPVTREEINKHYQAAAELCFSVPPGITGLWQVSGRSGSSYDHRISLDSWYVRNWNLWLDMVILMKTIRVVLKREGAQ